MCMLKVALPQSLAQLIEANAFRFADEIKTDPGFVGQLVSSAMSQRQPLADETLSRLQASSKSRAILADPAGKELPGRIGRSRSQLALSSQRDDLIFDSSHRDTRAVELLLHDDLVIFLLRLVRARRRQR